MHFVQCFDHLFNYEGHITEYNKIPGVTTWGNWRLWLNKEEKEKYGYQDYKDDRDRSDYRIGLHLDDYMWKLNI